MRKNKEIFIAIILFLFLSCENKNEGSIKNISVEDTENDNF